MLTACLVAVVGATLSFASVSVVRLGTRSRLYPALGGFFEYSRRETIFARLIDFDKLHVEGVALFETRLFDSGIFIIIYLRYMQKTLFARHKLYKHTVRHYRLHGRGVDFTRFGYSSDTSNLFQSGFDRVAVGSSNFYDTHFALFFDRDGSSRLGLYALYYLTLRSYYRTDKLFGYGDDFYPRYVWFEVGTRLGNSFRDFAQDVHTSFVSLAQSVLEYLVYPSVWR